MDALHPSSSLSMPGLPTHSLASESSGAFLRYHQQRSVLLASWLLKMTAATTAAAQGAVQWFNLLVPADSRVKAATELAPLDFAQLFVHLFPQRARSISFSTSEDSGSGGTESTAAAVFAVILEELTKKSSRLKYDVNVERLVAAEPRARSRLLEELQKQTSPLHFPKSYAWQRERRRLQEAELFPGGVVLHTRAAGCGAKGAGGAAAVAGEAAGCELHGQLLLDLTEGLRAYEVMFASVASALANDQLNGVPSRLLHARAARLLGAADTNPHPARTGDPKD